MPVVGLVRHRWRPVRPVRDRHRSRCEGHPVAVEGAQAAHSLHQRVGWVSDVGCVVGEVGLRSGVVRGVSASHPPSRQVPATPVVPSEGTHYYYSARILVVSQHVTHRYGIVPEVVGEGEHDVVLL